MTQRMKLAVLPGVVNKIAEDDAESWERTASEFENVKMTISELADHINSGHAFCVQHQGRRRSE